MGKAGQKTQALAVKQEIAAQVLAIGGKGSHLRAAKAAGVRNEQISRWLGDDAFRARVKGLIEAGMEPARLRWQALVIRAIERLDVLVDSKDEVIAERSARTVLDRHKEFAPHQHQHDASGLTDEQLEQRLVATLEKLRAGRTKP